MPSDTERLALVSVRKQHEAAVEEAQRLGVAQSVQQEPDAWDNVAALRAECEALEKAAAHRMDALEAATAWSGKTFFPSDSTDPEFMRTIAARAAFASFEQPTRPGSLLHCTISPGDVQAFAAACGQEASAEVTQVRPATRPLLHRDPLPPAHICPRIHL